MVKNATVIENDGLTTTYYGYPFLLSAKVLKPLTMNNIVMYATATCPYCHAAERLLHSRGISDIAFIRVDLDFQKRAEMIERTGRRTVPQIYINNHHVGGFDDLQAMDHSGELNQLLNVSE